MKLILKRKVAVAFYLVVHLVKAYQAKVIQQVVITLFPFIIPAVFIKRKLSTVLMKVHKNLFLIVWVYPLLSIAEFKNCNRLVPDPFFKTKEYLPFRINNPDLETNCIYLVIADNIFSKSLKILNNTVFWNENLLFGKKRPDLLSFNIRNNIYLVAYPDDGRYIGNHIAVFVFDG